MSVLDFTTGDLFVIRVIKHLTTNPSNEWANSYEFQADSADSVAALQTLGDLMIVFEKALHAETVAFDRFIISTWEPDSVPYDPESFVSSPSTLVGQRPVTSTEVEPTGMALRVNRQCASGRFGNLFYRGALFENEVSSTAGIPILSDPATLASILGDSVDDSGLVDYFGEGAIGGLHMVMVNFNGTQIRPVTQLVLGGVSLIKQDHQWFNRTGSPEILARRKASAKS